MEQKVSISQIKKDLMSGGFYAQCQIPMAYTAGFPVFQIRNGSLCLLIPYLKYQTTGVVDRTLVFPIRYTILLELPTGKPVGFSNMEYHQAFGKVDFHKPIGYFRHEAIRAYTRKEYQALYNDLMNEYDKVANMLIFGDSYTASDENHMRELLRLLVEPCLRPIYRILDSEFYQKYF